MPYLINAHAMGIEFLPGTKNDHSLIVIYNSGNGLNNHPYNKLTGKFQTRLIFEVPTASLTEEIIAKLVLDHPEIEDVDAAYEAVSSIKGAVQFTHIRKGNQLKTNAHPSFWQTPQKGSNCTVEWIFAYLKAKISSNEYSELRQKFFECCCQQIRNSPHFLSKLEKFICLSAFARKIEKRKQRLEQNKES